MREAEGRVEVGRWAVYSKAGADTPDVDIARGKAQTKTGKMGVTTVKEREKLAKVQEAQAEKERAAKDLCPAWANPERPSGAFVGRAVSAQ